MTEKDTELSRPLVVGQKRDGRRCYDKDAKRELIESCLLPGVSVAGMAMKHGVNANLLRTWITQYQRVTQLPVAAQAFGEEALATPWSFVPVVQAEAPAKTNALSLNAELPNGVRLDLSSHSHDELWEILKLLYRLPCSGSTQD